MSYKTVKKTVGFCKKSPFKLVNCCCFPFCCFDKSQDRLRECSMKQGIYIDKLKMMHTRIVIIGTNHVQLLVKLSKTIVSESSQCW